MDKSLSYQHEIPALTKLLHNLRHSNALTVLQADSTLAVVDDAGHELLDFVTQSCPVPFVEELLVLILVLEAELIVVSEPPGRRHVGIALGTGNDKISFGLDAQTQLEGADAMGIAHHATGVNVDAVLHLRVEADVRIA